MNRRVMLIATAAILAVGAGLLTLNYLAQNRHVAQVPQRPVLVATAQIPAHEQISPSMVSIVTKPANEIEPGSLSSTSELKGEFANATILAGSVITSDVVSKDEGPGPGFTIKKGYRGVSIPVDEVRDVSGLVQAGDKVDVIASPPRVGNAQPAAYTILKDITVLAIGGQASPLDPGTPPPPGTPPTPVIPRSITLEVTPSQADLLTMADLNATLRLALRPKGDKSGTTSPIVFASTTYAQPPPAAPAAPAPAPAKPARTQPWSPVEVIDGDQVGGTSGQSGQR
jgi:pilus assembly protein CpaB